VASLALLAACAGAPVTWDVGAAAADVLPATYCWGAVESPPSGVVGAEAKRVVDRALRERGFTETADARLLVLARFGPASGGPSEWRYTPPPGALAGVVGIGGITIPSALFWGEWRDQAGGGERVELTLVDRVTSRVLCRGQTVFELRGYADSERIAAVREATEDLMAACPVRR